MVRSAITGISAVIDAKGRVLASLPLNEAGAIEGRCPRRCRPRSSPGDARALLLLLLGLWALAQSRSGT
jgi:apolipoprotein N-acyltransferase